MTQNEMILNHLRCGLPLTPIDALNRFGCFRLASRISDLRKEGHNIRVEMISRNGKTFAEYRLGEGISRQIPASSFKKQGELLQVSRVIDYSNFVS